MADSNGMARTSHSQASNASVHSPERRPSTTGRRLRTPGEAVRVEVPLGSGEVHRTSSTPRQREVLSLEQETVPQTSSHEVLAASLPHAVEELEDNSQKEEDPRDHASRKVHMVLSRLNCLSVSGAELEGLKEEILSLCREYDENREQLEKDVVVVTKEKDRWKHDYLEKADEEQRLHMNLLDLQSKVKELEIEQEKRGPDEPNENFLCPITQEIFKEPVVAADGHTYEKAALERWFKNHNLSPITGAELDNKIMGGSLTKQQYNNYTLRSIILDGYRRAPIINKKTKALASSKGMDASFVTPMQALAQQEERRRRGKCNVM